MIMNDFTRSNKEEAEVKDFLVSAVCFLIPKAIFFLTPWITAPVHCFLPSLPCVLCRL